MQPLGLSSEGFSVLALSSEAGLAVLSSEGLPSSFSSSSINSGLQHHLQLELHLLLQLLQLFSGSTKTVGATTVPITKSLSVITGDNIFW